jgi:glycosyltransferase involved in cell wall biosynthesis
MMGIANLVRFPKQLEVFKQCLDYDVIHRIFIMSIHPASLSLKLRQLMGRDIPAKVIITDEPPYETPEFYRSVSREEARARLNIPINNKIILYFGSYFFSKGADLLLERAKGYPDYTFYMVGDTKLTSFDYDIKERYQLLNVVWIDGYVSEETARDYFRACDIVALPYRPFYEHDTSGVFNQAMLAERNTLVPPFSPFMDIVHEYAVGDTKSLMLAMAHSNSTYNEYDEYLSAQKGWDIIGRNL